MALFKNKAVRKDQTTDPRRKRRTGERSATTHFFETSPFIAVGLFLLMVALVVFLCFVGQSPVGPQILPNQPSRVRVVAEFPFSFESRILTQRLREQQRLRVAPVYRLDMEPYLRFEARLNALDQALNSIRETSAAEDAPPVQPELERLAREHFMDDGVRLNSEDVLLLYNRLSDEERTRIFKESLMILRERYREGIHNPEETGLGGESPSMMAVEIGGGIQEVRIQDEAEALRRLRFNLSALDTQPDVWRALFRVMKTGIKPNITHDPVKTESRMNTAIANVPPVVVHVAEGESIVEPGQLVSPDVEEKLSAYRKELREREDYGWGFNTNLVQRIVFTLILMLAAGIYLQMGLPSLWRSNRNIALFALVLLFNLALIRLVLQLGETAFFINNGHLISILPYAAPMALGPLVITVLIGAPAALLIALLIASLFAIMLGNAVEVFLTAFLASLVGIYFAREVRLRAKLVRAGLLSGVSIAVCAAFFGLIYQVSPGILGQQMIVAVITGLITSIITIGLLPLLENIFKSTTDITLLELTDYNHPLLRRMQMVAPGTYHHSLMVANLAERAAVEIGANPLVCRVTALFHDIGKMIKPEYFAENQRDGINPHHEKNPSMSALVIKSHIKEGVDLARQYKLPTVFIDVIRQHHGTSLIQYFYHKAKRQGEEATKQQTTRVPFKPSTTAQGNTPSPIPAARDSGSPHIDESIYRYDGPRPRFKESAIVFFADGVEAASRSLRKVTPNSVQELIESIFNDRIEDHQLDECPLTLQEIKKIKQSFEFTLLNMLHSRVEYPGKEKASPPAERREPSSPAPAT
jgi:putative nucleotidyltransferase with HDIG domain